MRIYKFTEGAEEKDLIKIDDPKLFLKKKYEDRFSFGLDDLQRTGVYREMGWAYDFRLDLKQYLYKQYSFWQESYALNKTVLRKIIGGKINKIIDYK